MRWRNVGRVACLAAAGVLIATHGGTPRSAAGDGASRARAVSARAEAHRLPRLRTSRAWFCPGRVNGGH